MNLKVTLNWAYLKNEIDYETYKAAEISISDNPDVKGEAQSANDKADDAFCRAKIDAAVGNLEEIMHRYFLVSSGSSTTNNLVENKTSWEMNLYYADDSRRAINMNSLTTKCHRYVVAYVLAEWCKLALPSLVPSYAEKMSQEQKGIESLVNRKESPTLILDVNDGSTIDLSVKGLTATATVEQIAYGESASATVSVTNTTNSDGDSVPCFNFAFKIPAGAPGTKGDTGEKGADGNNGSAGADAVVDYNALKSYIDQKVSQAVASATT